MLSITQLNNIETKILKNRWTIYFLGLLIFFIYLPNVSPVHTWASAGVDHFDFVFAAKHHLVPHSTGFPVYIIPANIVLLIFPNAHPSWILSLALSTIPAVINVVLVFHITKTLVDKESTFKWRLYAPYISALSLASANLVLAQAFIVEVYTYSMMFMLITILFHVKEKYWWAAIFMGLSIGTHGLIMTMMFLLGLINIKKYFFKLPIIILFGIAPYLYLPWAQARVTDGSITTLLGNNWKDYMAFFRQGSSIFWWGTLPMWEVPIRLLETFMLLSTGIGLATLSLILSIRYQFKKYWWIWLVSGATLYYWLTVTVKITHVHFALSIPLLVILAGLGLKYSRIHPRFYLLTSAGLIAAIPFFWNIGVSVDTSLSAQAYVNRLDQLEASGTKNLILNMSYMNQGYKYDGKLNDGTAIWWMVLDHNYDKERRGEELNIVSVFPDRYTEYKARGSRDNVALWYRESLRDAYKINTPHSTLAYDHDSGEWYILWNETNKVLLRKYIYVDEEDDPFKNFWVPNISQFQLWLTADLLWLENPDWTVRLAERSGTFDPKLSDITYSRNLIPADLLQGLKDLYSDAGYQKGIDSFSK